MDRGLPRRRIKGPANLRRAMERRQSPESCRAKNTDVNWIVLLKSIAETRGSFVLRRGGQRG